MTPPDPALPETRAPVAPDWANGLLTAICCILMSLGASLIAQSPAPDQTPMLERLKHWSWQPLADVKPEAATHPVDAFVQAKLKAIDLAPSPVAKPHDLLRRLWLDLVGLPPTVKATTRFGSNPTDLDYEREVDELLASPAYGERWARHWLDLMRYSETLGHEFDFELPNAWRYRDYVIRAFNQDVPYDQFVREHIAGDILVPARQDAQGNNESIQATASWWFVEQTHAPVDAMQHQANRIDNQIDVFGKAFLGLTVACARCHDHKFDAIPTRDYYSLFGFVQSSRYVQAPLKTIAPESNEYQLALTRQRELARAWLPGAPTLVSDVSFRTEDVIIADATNSRSTWFLTNDGFGNEPWQGPFCANPKDDTPQFRQLPGRFWLSATAGSQREGTVATKTFELTHRYVHARVAGNHSRVKLIVDGFHIIRDPIYGDLHRNVDNQDAHWLTFDTSRWQGSKAHLLAIDQRSHDLGDPRHDRSSWPADSWIAIQSVSNSPHSTPPDSTPSPPEPQSVTTSNQAEWQMAKAALAAAMDDLPVAPTLPAMADGNGVDSPVYLRGNHKQPGEEAPRRFLSALTEASAKPAPVKSSGRLHLANSVVASDNPLPPRVIVNRLWHHLFGSGLVESVDNFGALGKKPTHPQLLDWLAQDFIRNGWSIKHSIRRIVTSHAYRQSSRQRPAAAETDPENALVHRQNLRPLGAEVLRDTLLSISGRLNDEMFGPSIQQPKEAITNARGKPGSHAPRDGHGRRSIYLAVRRNFLPEMLLAFDLPTPFSTIGKRSTSNVPAQALTLANAPLVHDLSESFAQRIMAHSTDATERIGQAYLLAFARNPRAAELEQVLAFVCEAMAREPKQELRVWTDALHALINTADFRFYR